MNRDWLEATVLDDYLDGNLDAKDMHFVERHALEDPFVAEALEGLKVSPTRKQTLSLLQKQLQERTSQLPVRRRHWEIGTYRLSIAATAAVLFVTASLIFWMRSDNLKKQGELAGKKVEVALPPATQPAQPNIPSPIKGVNPAVAGAAVGESNVAVFQGNVLSEADKRPIPGAVILNLSNGGQVVTDKNGKFELKSDSLHTTVLKISSPGFVSRELSVKRNEPVSVSLQKVIKD